MARKIRLFVKDTPQHVVIRGIDSVGVFLDEEDYQTFIAMIKVLVEKIEIELHAYILMPTYFQFLATPLHEKALSQFMQNLGRRYVGYFNKKYERKGTIWNGRYKASLVEVENYLFEVMRFIEREAQEQKVIDDFKRYPYSSVQKNIFSKDDAIIMQHKIYSTHEYLAYINSPIESHRVAFVASSLEKQTVTGSIEFMELLKKELGDSVVEAKRGRPKKDRQNNQRKKMYNNLVLINKKAHKDFRVSTIENFSFAKNLKFIPVVSLEISKISTDYPVVFSKGENPIIGALVALDKQNLAISQEGKWYGSYVPAYVRKYPFALASSKQNPEQLLLLMDNDSSLISKDKGELLFNEDGTQSSMFQKKIELISVYEADRKRTDQIIKVILNANILENGDIIVGEGEERKSLVTGFQAINRKRYEALSEDKKQGWKEAGIIDFIEAHLKSLESINNLFTLASQQQA